MIYNEFGTPFRATFAMFECTFANGWLTKFRMAVDVIGPGMSVFWLVYVVIVNFAVIRIVSALFLKQTMAVASQDADRMAMEKVKQQGVYADKLREIYLLADTSGDGRINYEEFQNMISQPHVMHMFDALDLDEDELVMLFNVLSSDDGMVDFEEFLGGAMKMKNTSRCIDSIQILHEQTVMKRLIFEITDRLDTQNNEMATLSVSVNSLGKSPAVSPTARFAGPAINPLYRPTVKSKEGDAVYVAAAIG
eukprot:gnl/TRDRNA2_/TRDRNA2_140319_c2_seq1.p1 gnl/TRDRNA2_/TRDRNA2_140319_c2~~gnl/TRDRNA2_/TRDRNA2_140319_c2_seq1.p1  ORF type:complete len:250 (-),score=35.69 gnl/TRDRNA2_/TRDRNA2_140319_c2_seq1:141-890(-)